MLHITNGDSAAGTLREAGMEGEILSWRDVLHDGPVPADLPLPALSQVRADFIASCGRMNADEVRRGFAERDAALAASGEEDEVVLWFEHDLYDQLQLIQLLDWFADRPHPRLTLVNPAEYLGPAPPERLRELFPARALVTDAQRMLGRDAWRAFRSPDPRGIEAIARGDTSPLPHLAAALVRWLEELPSADTGLSRSESATLDALAEQGEMALGYLYGASHHAREEAVWMGDWSFYDIVDGLAEAETPLVHILDPATEDEPARRVRITAAGERVRGGLDDAVRMNGIDRWMGGIHLHGRDLPWRWDARQQRVVTG
jgi:hypothetical protein